MRSFKVRLAICALALFLVLGAQSRYIKDLVVDTLTYEGTVDAFETTITFTDPTVDRSLVVPDSSGNLLISGQCIGWISLSLNPSESATLYGSFQGTAASTTETNVDDTVIPIALAFHTLRAAVDVAPNNGAGTQSWTVTLRRDAVSTALTCAISESDIVCADSTNSVSVPALSKIDIAVTPAGTPTTSAELLVSLCTGP